MLGKQDALFVMFAIILAIANSTPNVQFGHCTNYCSIKILITLGSEVLLSFLYSP